MIYIYIRLDILYGGWLQYLSLSFPALAFHHFSENVFVFDLRQLVAISFLQHSKRACYLVANNLGVGGPRPELRSTLLNILSRA